MSTDKDIFFNALLIKYYRFLIRKLETVHSQARDKEYAIWMFMLEVTSINEMALRPPFNEELVRIFNHHFKIGAPIDTTLREIPALKSKHEADEDPFPDPLYKKSEIDILKFLVRYAAIEQFKKTTRYDEGFSDEEEEIQPPLFSSPPQELSGPQENKPKPTSLSVPRVKRDKEDQYTKLSQEETALLAFYLQRVKIFLGPDFVSKSSLGAIMEAATGYSGESIRKSLSELPNSKNPSTREKLQKIQLMLAELNRLIDKELGK